MGWARPDSAWCVFRAPPLAPELQAEKAVLLGFWGGRPLPAIKCRSDGTRCVFMGKPVGSHLARNPNPFHPPLSLSATWRRWYPLPLISSPPCYSVPVLAKQLRRIPWSEHACGGMMPCTAPWTRSPVAGAALYSARGLHGKCRWPGAAYGRLLRIGSLTLFFIVRFVLFQDGEIWSRCNRHRLLF